MSALTIVDGLLEGLQLVSALTEAAQKVSAAITAAQQANQPVDFTGILGDINTDEASVLAAIAAAKAAGK